jgi:hypothetical protein
MGDEGVSKRVKVARKTDPREQSLQVEQQPDNGV